LSRPFTRGPKTQKVPAHKLPCDRRH
jgi:hypothetical protein